MVDFSKSVPRVLEPGTESEYTPHRSPVHKRVRTCHIHTNTQSPASLISTVLDYPMHQEKMREDRKNIAHHSITKKHSIATIKLATSFNMEAAFSNFQAPMCILYSDGLIPISTRKSSTNGRLSFPWRVNKSTTVNSTVWRHVFYLNLSYLLLCLRTPPTNLGLLLLIFNNDAGLGCMNRAGRRLKHTNVSGQSWCCLQQHCSVGKKRWLLQNVLDAIIRWYGSVQPISAWVCVKIRLWMTSI